jgi:hypothetical protein
MAVRKNKTILRTPGDVNKAWQQIEKEIARLRKDAEGRGQVVDAITRAEFEAKLKRVNSPMIVAHGWSPTAPPGGTITYWVYIRNFDIQPSTNIALTVFVGNRNAIAGTDEFFSGFDTRFPTYALGAPNGFTMGPAQPGMFSFQVAIPQVIEKTGYFGNFAIQKVAFLGAGTVIERSCFFFEVA